MENFLFYQRASAFSVNAGFVSNSNVALNNVTFRNNIVIKEVNISYFVIDSTNLSIVNHSFSMALTKNIGSGYAMDSIPNMPTSNTVGLYSTNGVQSILKTNLLYTAGDAIGCTVAGYLSAALGNNATFNYSLSFSYILIN